MGKTKVVVDSSMQDLIAMYFIISKLDELHEHLEDLELCTTDKFLKDMSSYILCEIKKYQKQLNGYVRDNYEIVP